MSEKDLQKEILDLKAQIKKLQKNNLGLVFEDKLEDVVEQSKTKVPVLKEVKKNRLNLGVAYLNNLMIEGDNYLALSVLNYTHKKKIDLIYIDPPYNTGARDWKYNNDYVDSEDAYRHSKWLSMMSHRLTLAKELLKDDGFIVCAIDHNELSTLGVLMDKIFGEQNRLGIISVVHKPEGRNQEKFFGTSNEFMFVYARNKNNAQFNTVILEPELAEKYNLSDDFGNYRLQNFIRLTDGKLALRNVRPNFWYPIYVNPKTLDVSAHKVSKYAEVYPVTTAGVEMSWKTLPDTLKRNIVDGNIIARKDDAGRITILEKIREDQVVKTHWVRKEYNAIQYGTKILNDILGEKKFDFPKSVHLVTDVVKLMTKRDAIVLDFFAGSGTTGHAVLEMNKIDGGNRKFIICTNNENNNGGVGGIADSVCYPRIKAVIKGYKSKNGEKVVGIPSNLLYYQTDLVDIEQIHKVPDDAKIRVTYQAGEMIAVREETLNEVEKNDWWQIFESQGRMTAIYFKEDKSKLGELIEKLEKNNTPVALYIFSWGKNEYKGEYSSENIRVEDIPEPILEVYKEINRL
jgi:adenine-specific DNA-methyltransferase